MTAQQRQTMDERLGKVFAAVVVAAVVCAGCVGWSFISHRIAGKSPYTPEPRHPGRRAAVLRGCHLAQGILARIRDPVQERRGLVALDPLAIA
ncbi:hypothetical protein [Streptomyces sp. NPDC018584]|uniref:hypothetical protein n=1 Tax=unclassified Streptomyces TaxID=2593676 RepID=UPI0037945D4E